MIKKTAPPFLDTERSDKENPICPHIAFADDPETAVAYPSSSNCCYNARPVVPVDLAKQRSYCLSSKYWDCPVFQRESLEPLPKAFRGSRPAGSPRKRWLSLVGLGFLVLVVLAILVLTGLIKIPGIFVNPENQAFVFPVTTPTATYAPSVTPTPMMTETLPPTPTETLVVVTLPAPRVMETPFGRDPQLIIHSLKEGEGYLMVAGIYNTTVEAITAINYNLPTTALWVGTILVIPVNSSDVTGLPQFSTYEVDTEGLAIEDLATRLNLDAAELKKYNDFPDGYQLSRGEWLIIPHSP